MKCKNINRSIKKYYYFKLLTFIIILLSSSCKNEIEIHSSSDCTNNLTVQIYDSITIDKVGVFLPSDYLIDSNYYLITDYLSKEIYILNDKSEIKHTINRFGSGPEEYGDIRGISFYGTDKIILLEAFKAIIYSLNGNFIEKIIFPQNLLANPSFHYDVLMHRQSILLNGGEKTEYNIFQPSFYKTNTWITKLEKNDKTYESGVPFESGSIYREDNFYGLTIPSIDINNDTIAVLFPYDKKLYFYNAESLKLIESIPTNPNFFSNPTSMKFPKNPDDIKPQSLFRAEQINSAYSSLRYLEDNYILTYYMTGLPESKIVDDHRTYSEKGLDNYRKKYFQLFQNGVKLSCDIKIDSKLTYYNAFSKNQLLFARPTEEEKRTTFLIGKIIEIN